MLILKAPRMRVRGPRAANSQTEDSMKDRARIGNGADAKQSTMDRLQRALEAAGVEFTNGNRPGVCLIEAPAMRSVAHRQRGRRKSSR